jgi:hypothetical protein
MAKTKISEYDATAANNTDIDSINIAEGMAPSNVNNAIRELMAHLKDMDAGTQALTSPQLTSADINGGTLDGVTIGGASAGAGTFTNLTATGTTTLAGASTSADITFGDNDKAIFGAGSDLQIYHDGSDSYIDEAAAGDLYIRAYDRLKLNNYTDNAAMLNAKSGAEVELYYNGGLKLATSSSGVDITGVLSSDGLTSETSDGIPLTLNGGANASFVQFTGGTSDDFRFGTVNSKGTLSVTNSTDDRYILDIGNSGDISFYEDTGTTAKFFWDASAESLGIGTSSPDNTLHLLYTDNTTYTDGLDDQGLQIENNSTTTNAYTQIHFRTYNTDSYIRSINTGSGASDLSFITDANGTTEAMRIDSSGNVGIGTTSPSRLLTISPSSGSAQIALVSQDSSLSEVLFGDAADDNVGRVYYDHTSNFMSLWTNGSERMRIDSSGNLLVGKPTTAFGTQGVRLSSVGTVIATSNGNAPAELNRLTSDGTILGLYKDGSTVGSIGSASGATIYIDGGSQFAGLQFGGDGSSEGRITPRRNGASADAATDLGTSSLRFKDIHLSGSVYADLIRHKDDTDTYIQWPGNNTLAFNTGASERMRIDSSGNVGIGTSSPANLLHIRGGAATLEIDSSTNTANLDFDNSTQTARIQLANNDLTTLVGGTEAMRIDSSGTTSFHGISGRATGSTGHLSISEQTYNRSYLESATTTTSSITLMAFINPNGAIGSISVSGSSTAFNTSSDYRLKENVVEMTGATDRVKQLEPKRFNFIADADTTVDGFLAHEVQSVVPEAITGTKDAVDADGNPEYQGIDQSKLVPLLVATIQELEARITALENA